jgi:stringent starvation protein B
VHALYARETGHGMTFDIEPTKPAVQASAEGEPAKTVPTALPAPSDPKKPSGGKPRLTRVK